MLMMPIKPNVIAKPKRDDQQNRAKAQAVKNRAKEIDERNVALDDVDGAAGRL